VPVLDLRAGQIVVASGPDRGAYPVLDAPDLPGTDPVAVAGTLSGRYAFHAYYVADLDALAGGPMQTTLVDALARRLDGAELWVDAGIRDDAGADAFDALPASVRPVLGTETLPGSTACCTRIIERLAHRRPLLSIDRRAGRLVGHLPDLDADIALLFDAIIELDFDRIGTRRIALNHGDAPRTGGVFGTRPRYLAGGIGNRDDVRRVHAAGYAGVLVATALYRGHLLDSDLTAQID